ncbi:MAG TPA: hypothetical protein ENF48_01315 [Desulfobacteraceae bacterium]|nr:hypothetical protein [Deltaproteobacteria bacterium]HDI58991.1 hypothetical protein [Desulfobacteraceae bacterium]
MTGDFIDELLGALARIAPLNHGYLKEILILSGWPEETQNLRYLAYNRQVLAHGGANLEFSAVAVINNRRAARWRLEGWRRTVSRLVFHPLWANSKPMDLFLIQLRSDAAMTDLMAASRRDFTLFGILRSEPLRPSAAVCEIRPVIGLPGLDREGLARVENFETHNRLRA